VAGQSLHAAAVRRPRRFRLRAFIPVVVLFGLFGTASWLLGVGLYYASLAAVVGAIITGRVLARFWNLDPDLEPLPYGLLEGR
jgi:hypothetical protein